MGRIEWVDSRVGYEGSLTICVMADGKLPENGKSHPTPSFTAFNITERSERIPLQLRNTFDESTTSSIRRRWSTFNSRFIMASTIARTTCRTRRSACAADHAVSRG